MYNLVDACSDCQMKILDAVVLFYTLFYDGVLFLAAYDNEIVCFVFHFIDVTM